MHGHQKHKVEDLWGTWLERYMRIRVCRLNVTLGSLVLRAEGAKEGPCMAVTYLDVRSEVRRWPCGRRFEGTRLEAGRALGGWGF